MPSAFARGGGRLALVAALVVMATTCASEAPNDDAGETTATTAAPPEELQVLLAGDSVAENLAAPLRAALRGSASTRYVALLTIPRDGEQFLWEATLSENDPDVVVVLIGTWEIDEVLGETDFPRSYESGVVDPFIAQTTESGADIVWIGMPSTRSARTPIMRDLVGVYREAVARHGSGATFVDADDVLTDPSGRWTQTLPGPDGGPESLRGDDGAHLCPAGAVRVVQQVLDVLAQRRPVTPTAGWETGGWRTAPAEPFPAICAEG